MCRNIKTLFNFDPPATDEEIRDAALQFVRKLSGSNKPSKRNEDVFNLAVERLPIALRRRVQARQLSHELQRGVVYLGIRGRRIEIE